MVFSRFLVLSNEMAVECPTVRYRFPTIIYGALMTDDPQSTTIAWFNSLPPISPAELIGLWRGEGIPSGHPLDGVLENLNWFGKRFHADLRADALLFQWRPGRLVPLDPRRIPIRAALKLATFGKTPVAKNWFSYLHQMIRASGTTASVKLRMIDDGETAAMVYDTKPIVDFFRRIGDDEIAGMMIIEQDQRRYFFRLHRVAPLASGASE
ncbi:uncharacterized protein DUF4334 [Neorhizobium alkalisoli]|uniref:Uncharacterized protein DUF4334 n=2 Tax=Neorhizobium alkalisoli TaxID=528178 RepID=A0A561QGK4_9HYPH|nr:uncharacterized protein DUF4334 [Neorhizobium alkalisoli]